MTTAPTIPSTTDKTLSKYVFVLAKSRVNEVPSALTVDFNGEAIYYLQLSNILFKGNVDENLNFEYGEGTNAFYGCGATLFGEMWYFGGGRFYTQQVCVLYIIILKHNVLLS